MFGLRYRDTCEDQKKDHTSSRNSDETKQSIVVQLEVWQTVKKQS